MRDERSKEIGLSASGFCSESNPSPGTKISTPEFGYELFVARTFCRTMARFQQPKVIHRHSQLSTGHIYFYGYPPEMQSPRQNVNDRAWKNLHQ
jgi:hypothetical protein